MTRKFTLFCFFCFFSMLFGNNLNSESLLSNKAFERVYLNFMKDNLIFADFFSPNGDGHNDTFMVENLKEYPINKMHIFNRWGETVFTSEPYRNDWDGTMNVENQWFGKVLPEGMYFYRFEYIIGDFLTQTNGKIMLKR